MTITRHAIDRKWITVIFEESRQDTGKELTHAREKPSSLDFLYRHAIRVYSFGGVIDPNSPEVGEALRLAAQAGTAIFTCRGPGEPPPPFELGEGPLVQYSKPVDSCDADYPTWLKVYDLCLITRQPRLSDAVCAVPNEVFRGSQIIGAATEDYTFADMLRAVWTKDRFTEAPAFSRIEEKCLSQPRSAKYVHGVTVPYLRALRCLERSDSAGFTEALTEALKGHKAFYSTKKYREEPAGFFSLRLTAVAALAWDRGLRFDVESDYAPRSWVTGALFRQTHPGG